MIILKKRKYLVVLIVPALFFLVAYSALAWIPGEPIVPCGTSTTAICQRCDLFKLLRNVMDFILLGFMPPVAVALFVSAGLMILLGAANPGLVGRGKTIFWNTFVGIIILLASWLITNTIINSVLPSTASGNWWTFSCSNSSPPVIPPTTGSLTVTTRFLSDGVLDQPYSQTFNATGGTQPYTWSIYSGAQNIPPELTLDSSTGTISGTPTQVGTFTFLVQVMDSSNPQQTAQAQSFEITIRRSVPDEVAIYNLAYKNVVLTGATITWETDKLATSQVEYGTTTTYGQATPITQGTTVYHSIALFDLTPDTTYYFRAVSTRGNFTARSSPLSFKTTSPIGGGTLAITTASLPDAALNQAYSFQLQRTGGLPPFGWSIIQGGLPQGLTLGQASGIISGTPTGFLDTYNFTVQVMDATSNPSPLTSTRSLSITLFSGGVNPPVACLFSGVNLCQPSQTICSASSCNQYIPSINKYATGAAESNLLKAIMVKESSCDVIAVSNAGSYGLMQLRPSTANIYKNRCAITANIDGAWLTDPQNADSSICIAAEYIKSLAGGICGNSTRNIAAGYNGGVGACQASNDCLGQNSCDGSTMKKWECLYDDPQHQVCNTGYDETRDYATKVLYCYNNPGF